MRLCFFASSWYDDAKMNTTRSRVETAVACYGHARSVTHSVAEQQHACAFGAMRPTIHAGLYFPNLESMSFGIVDPRAAHTTLHRERDRSSCLAHSRPLPAKYERVGYGSQPRRRALVTGIVLQATQRWLICTPKAWRLERTGIVASTLL